jgi:N-methylhydantoinase B
MTVDKVLLEVLNNRFTGVVEEMGYVIHRAAFTTFVKETWDFDSALLTPDGEVFAYPRNIGVTNMLCIDLAPAIGCFDEYQPGDVILTNDPFYTKGMCTHLPDYMLYRPLFEDGKIVCFAWCFVHSSDVGGMVPGSIAPSADDKMQEGVTIPPVKLFKAGVLDEEIRRLVLANCRIPEQNWGDLRALLAALSIAEKRLHDIFQRYGTENVETIIRGLIDYAELRARDVFSAIPDGEYPFSDYLEGDSFGTYHTRIKLKMTVRGSDVELDFGGTDPQVPAAFNVPTFGKLNQFLVLGIVNFLRTSDPHIPFNRGMVRPVAIKVPEGSLLNPTRFAATGVRYTTALRISDVVMGALSEAVPERIPAAGAGQMGILTLSDVEPQTGSYKLHVLEPLQGGSGGRPTKDGIDGVNFSGGALRNAPVESLELDAPILVTRYSLADEVAPGKFRGGAGVVFECQLLSPHALITSRGWDRFRMRAWGRFGGSPGELGQTVRIDRLGNSRSISKIDVLKLDPGETVRVTSPSGGGYGNPLDRDPQRVWQDVQNGFVTTPQARTQYGVVLDSNGIDVEATRQARNALQAKQGDGGAFSYGEERKDYESGLPERVQDLVAELLSKFPAATRQQLRNIAYDFVLKNGVAAATEAALAALILQSIDQARKPVLHRTARVSKQLNAVDAS